jgi:hypothetical protein
VFMHIEGTCHCSRNSSTAFLLPPNEVDRDATVARDCTEANDLAQGRENGYMVLVKMAECKTVYGLDLTFLYRDVRSGRVGL